MLGPREWLEGKARVAGAMAGGRKLADTHKTRSTAYEMRNKLHGEREGTTMKLTAGRTGSTAARSRRFARRRAADSGDLGAAVAGLSRCLASVKKRAGSNRVRGGGHGFHL